MSPVSPDLLTSSNPLAAGDEAIPADTSPPTWLYLLAFDPSTGRTAKGHESAVGAVVLAFNACPLHATDDGDPHLIDCGAWFGQATSPHKDSEARLWERLRSIRSFVASWVADLPCAIDVLTYEKHTGQGFFTSRALDLGVGMLLTLPCFDGMRPCGIAPNTAKAASGAGKLTRDDAKAKTQEWARSLFGNAVCLRWPGPEQEAIADACAVAAAYYNTVYRPAYLEALAKQAQGTMRLPKDTRATGVSGGARSGSNPRPAEKPYPIATLTEAGHV